MIKAFYSQMDVNIDIYYIYEISARQTDEKTSLKGSGKHQLLAPLCDKESYGQMGKVLKVSKWQM